MNSTTWLTDGNQTFEAPIGSPLEKRLLAQGYEECADPNAPVEGEPAPADTEGDKEPEADKEPEGEPAPADPSVPGKAKAKAK